MTSGKQSAYVYAGVARWGGGGSQSAKPGTLGGVFRMPVEGGAWRHMMTGFPEVVHVHCITVHPSASNIIFAGAHDGVYRSEDHGETWMRLASATLADQIWSIAISPHDDATIFAGASPTGVHKSVDGGATWRRMASASIPDRLPMGSFKNRVMRIAMNPKDPLKVFAALEVNGAMASDDGGETWRDCGDDLVRLSRTPELRSRILTQDDAEGMLDAHALTLLPDDGTTVYLANRMGLFHSRDDGRTWLNLDVGRFSPLTYARDVRASLCEPDTLYACVSVSSNGETGSIVRSADRGRTWARFDHGVTPGSTAMAVAQHPECAEIVHFIARKGEVFGSLDAGHTWRARPLPSGCEGAYCIACG